MGEERSRSKQDKVVSRQHKQGWSGQVTAEAPGAYAGCSLLPQCAAKPDNLNLSPRILMTGREN